MNRFCTTLGLLVAIGGLTGAMSSSGYVPALTYDNADRLTQKSYVGGSDVIGFGYDDANQLTYTGWTNSGNNVSTLRFAYDGAGRLTNETQIVVRQVTPLGVGYQYFPDGRRKRLTYPDSTFITYEYNSNGWLTAIKDGGTNSIVTYDYDAAGRRTKRTLENNTFTVYDYDNADQLSAISHQRSTGGVTNLISRYEYAYDAAGNRTNMVGTSGSLVRSESYAYDAADQLAAVTYKTGSVTDRTVNYFYDAAGNRTNLVERIGNATNTTAYVANSDNQLTNATATRQGLTVTGVVNPGASSNKWYASTATARGQQSAVSSQNGTFAIPGVPVTGGANALTVTVTDVSGNIATQVVNITVATAPTALGYDGNGNQTNDAEWSYSYDRENRLVSASSASLAVNYNYDALGRLIERRTSGSVTTNRLYYAGWQLIAEYNGAGSLQRKYVYGPGIDEPIRMTTGGTNYYYHADGLGSTTEITDSSGLKAESYSYDVYGAPTIYNSSGVVTNNSATANRLMFTGRDRDPDTGWYNYRYRYYNASLGRFSQPDPIGVMGGDLNFYRYSRNSLPNYIDPYGLAAGELNQLREKVGGVIVLGPWDAWDAGPGRLGSRAFQLANAFARTQPKLPCETEAGYEARKERIRNAFRHVIWQAMLTQAHGAGKAKRVGNLHELGEEDTYDSQVDQYHNMLGRELGLRTTRLGDAIRGAKELYEQGRLIHRLPDPRIRGARDSSYHIQEDRGRDNIAPLYY